MSQNHLKIEHPEIESRCHGCQNVRIRCHLQGVTLSEVYFMPMHHLWTFRINLGCDIDNLRLLELISGQKPEWPKRQICTVTLTALALRPYIYGHFASRDWYSGHTHGARARGRRFNPRRVRYLVFALFLLSRSARAQIASVAIPA